ncbi:MAG: MMPL family transporter [Candidatus Bipolaricaulota bacterium]
MRAWLGRVVTRRPWWVLAAVLAVTLGLGVFVPQLEFQADYSLMLPGDDPVVEQYERTLDQFGAQSVFMVAMAASEGGSVFDLASLEKLYAITEELEELEARGWLEEVVSAASVEVVEGREGEVVADTVLPGPPQSPDDAELFRERVLSERELRDTLVLADGSAALLVLRVHPDVEDREDILGEIQATLEDVAGRYEAPESFYITGDAPMLVHANRHMRQDLSLLFPVVVLVVSCVLLASFRLWRGLLLPLAVVLLAVVWTLGLMGATGYKLTMISSFLPVLLVAVGSAYGIHVMNAFLQRAKLGGSREEAVQEVVGDMLGPVSGTAFTTAAGFLTLLSSFLIPSREFGVFSAFGVLAAFVLTMTLIPAFLVLLPAPPAGHRRGVPRWDRAVARLSGTLARRPRWTLLVAVGVMGGLLVGVPLLQVESDFSEYFHEDSAFIQGQKFVEERFGGSQELRVVVEADRQDAFYKPEMLAFMAGLQDFLADRQEVGDTSSLADVVKEVHYTFRGDDQDYYKLPDSARAVAQLLLIYEMGGGEGLRPHVTQDYSTGLVTARVRSVGMAGFLELQEAVEGFLAEELPSGTSAYVTGAPSIYMQISRRIIQSQVVSLGTSLGAVLIIVALVMGSFVAGLCALIPLVVAIAGNFGVMGYAGAQLDMATVMIASLAVGIGVDYAVHFLMRYRRLRSGGRPHSEALAETYSTAGRAILINALTLTMGFLVMLLSSFGALVAFGWLITLTMVTTLLGALFVLPAVLGMVQPSFLQSPFPFFRAGTSATESKEVNHDQDD